MSNIPSNIILRVLGLSSKFIHCNFTICDRQTELKCFSMVQQHAKTDVISFPSYVYHLFDDHQVYLLIVDTRYFSLIFTTQFVKSCFPQYRNFDETSCSLSWLEDTLKANICVVQLGAVKFRTQNSLRSKNLQTGGFLASQRIP